MFNYPQHIITEIKRMWPESFGSSPEYWDLPCDAVLQSLIEIAYHASFLTEEGRSISFKLIYISKDVEKIINDAPIGFNRRYIKIITFDTYRVFNTNEVLRLSPASDFIQSLMCIDNFGSEKTPELKIWGLMDGGTTWWNTLHGNYVIGLPIIKKLIISSMGPGHITLSRGEKVLLSLNNGGIIGNNYNIFYEGKVKTFFKESIVSYNKEILSKLKKDMIKTGFKVNDGSTYIDLIKSIIFHIRENRHGGVLIIVNDKTPALNSKISFKYKCNYDIAWDLLIRREKDLHNYLYLSDYLQTNHDENKFSEYSALVIKLKEYDEAIVDSINFISALSNIDGSIVITDKLRLLGFGGEILSSDPEFNILSTDTGESIKIDNYGTRHRSAFRLCYSVKKSLGIIVSQDGSIKVVKRDKNNLLMWSNINLGFFGI